MQNFKKLKIWQNGIKVVLKTYGLTRKLPYEERFGLVSQMNRASVSIPSNIAEGTSRKSQKEFHHYLQIALGSTFELETQLIVIEELELIDEAHLHDLKDLVTQEQKMLTGLLNKVIE